MDVDLDLKWKCQGLFVPRGSVRVIFKLNHVGDRVLKGGCRANKDLKVNHQINRRENFSHRKL